MIYTNYFLMIKRFTNGHLLKSKHKLKITPQSNISLLVEKGESIEDYKTDVILKDDLKWAIQTKMNKSE